MIHLGRMCSPPTVSILLEEIAQTLGADCGAGVVGPHGIHRVPEKGCLRPARRGEVLAELGSDLGAGVVDGDLVVVFPLVR